MCDAFDERHQLSLVRLITLRELLPDIAENRILMGGIAENGPVVALQLLLERPDELEVGEMVFLSIQVLPGVTDRAVALDDVV